MTILTNWKCSLINGLSAMGCFIIFGTFLSFGVHNYSHDRVMIARYNVEREIHAVAHARYETFKAQIELEARRISVENEIRKVVMAEYRNCKRGKC
jgi:hypothetical protein